MISRLLLKFWLLPPAINIILIVVGLLLLNRRRGLGLFLALLGVISLWLLSTSYVSNALLKSIERDFAYQVSSVSEIPSPPEGKAIVVLGAAHYDLAKEYGVSTPNADALVRLHYAASLHRRTQLPILLTGGAIGDRQDKHAEVMAHSLQQVFDIEPKWLETESGTTWQNALYSARILLPEGIDEVVLVTHSYHMPRARHLFELAGFTVIAAPTQLASDFDVLDWRKWVPNSFALDLSRKVIHEYLGLMWYWVVSPVGNRFEG